MKSIKRLGSFLRALGLLKVKRPNFGPNTFLLWEPSSKSHGEIVPGYTKYLRDLGFDVLVMLTPERLSEGLFDYYSDPRITFSELSQSQIRRFIKSADLSKAAGLIVTTAGKLPKKNDGSIDFDAVFGESKPFPLLLVEHDAREMIDNDVWKNEYITLREINYKGRTSTIVNPHYFGNFSERTKPNGARFLMVGAARLKRGNHDLIYNAALKMLQDGISSFEISVIGKTGQFKVPEELKDKVKVLGRVSYGRLYEEVSKADFIVTSFQKLNENHSFYYTGGTSGSFQLAYGFCKPVIVQESIANFTDLNDGNSILYDEDDQILEAMKRAVRMDDYEYAKMVLAMKETARNIYSSSLKNMGSLING